MDIKLNIDTVSFVILLLLGLVWWSGINVGFIHSLYKGWIRKGKTIEFFPSWKGSKKPFHWFLGWSVAKCIADGIIFLVYILAIVVYTGKAGFIALIPGVWLVSCFFEMIFYAISETIAVSIVRRKNPQPNSEAINTDVIADNVIENEEADLTDEENGNG